ncbi:hypothetical protein [Nostoc sp. FACHB-110]|uniref:hypothetical protein n=1 Tax=Nostoc sp. FACHB-110 TaxID=2692834 RepID=UPI001686BAF4|nr:hypothetical protein [Nostoc sp. FACHB-110]MBD2437396.1 hypothetical protein [Nostoc sp. FACHB-110]
MRNYPDPDPAWDYYAIYQQATQAHAKLEQLLQYFASPECENATPEADKQIIQLLGHARQAIEEAESISSILPHLFGDGN